MTPSTPRLHHIQSELKAAPYWAFFAGATAIVLTFFVPFYPAYIGVALGLGALSFAIWWIGARKGVRLHVIGVVLTLLGWSAARSALLPHEMSTVFRVLTATQFLASWMLIRATLQLAIRSVRPP